MGSEHEQGPVGRPAVDSDILESVIVYTVVSAAQRGGITIS